MHMETKLDAYVLGLSLPSSIDRALDLLRFFLLPKERYPVSLEELKCPLFRRVKSCSWSACVRILFLLYLSNKYVCWIEQRLQPVIIM
jgi:hypothetical protein